MHEDFPGVFYRIWPIGWIVSNNIHEWLREPRAIKMLQNHLLRSLFVDNFICHNLNEDILQAAEDIRTKMRYLIANMAHKTQSLDSFVI